MNTATEQHRHRCEVRQLLQWRVERGLHWVRDWLYGSDPQPGEKQRRVKGAINYRGDAAVATLVADCREQWELGNRGADGDWRATP